MWKGKRLIAFAGVLGVCLLAVTLNGGGRITETGDRSSSVLMETHHKSAAERAWDRALAHRLSTLGAAEAEGKKESFVNERGEGFRGRGLGHTKNKVRKEAQSRRDDGRGSQDHASRSKLRLLERKLRASRRKLQDDTDRLHIQNHLAKMREASLIRLLARQKAESRPSNVPARYSRGRDWRDQGRGGSANEQPSIHRANKEETLADLVMHVKRVAGRMKHEKSAFQDDRKELEHTKRLINRALSVENKVIQRKKDTKAEGAHGLGVKAMVMATVDGQHTGNPFKLPQPLQRNPYDSSGVEARAPSSYGADTSSDGLEQSGYRTGYHLHSGGPSVKKQDFITSVFGAEADKKASIP